MTYKGIMTSEWSLACEVQELLIFSCVRGFRRVEISMSSFKDAASYPTELPRLLKKQSALGAALSNASRHYSRFKSDNALNDFKSHTACLLRVISLLDDLPFVSNSTHVFSFKVETVFTSLLHQLPIMLPGNSPLELGSVSRPSKS